MATVKLDPAKGVQIPNMTTTERNAVSSPETGALIWNTTTSAVNQYNGSAWGTVGISEDTTKLPLAGGALTGAVTTNSTFDGVDIATRDAILTSTTTTAGAALPKAGGSMTGHLELNDNVKAAFGQSGDLEIYHDGSNSYINDIGTGNLLIKGQNLKLLGSNDDNIVFGQQGGAVTLYHNNAAKLATSAGGVTVTGAIVSSDKTVSSSDPTATSNVSAVGHLWINSTSGESYICKDVTNNDNVWINIGSGDGNINVATISTVDVFGDSSCKALWHLNSNKTDAGGNYNLTSSGTEVWSTGKFSTAWDGSGSNILYYSSSNIVGTSAHSASFWYKNATASQSNKRVLTVNGGTGGQCAGFSNYNSSLGFYTGSGVNVGGSIPAVARRVEIPDSSVNDNAWHHLAWSITSGGTWVLYLDGSEWTGTANEGDSRSFNAAGSVSGSYVIITGYDTTSGGPHECDCLIDQVRLFDRVITATEVATLYGFG
jgi:hypothetical protein